MSCRVIKKQWYRLVYGLEHHNGIYWCNIFNGLAPAGAPPVPIPAGMMPAIPESVHAVQYAATQWLDMDDKSHANILADGSPVLSRNHTLKKTPHCPPGINVAVVSTIAFATSTFKLGVASVQGNGQALASTACDIRFVTVHCADPCSTPTGFGFAPGTVHITPTGDDWAQAALEYYMAAQVEIAASWVFGKVLGPVADFVSKRLPVSRFTAEGVADLRDALVTKFGKTASDAGKKAVADQARKQAEQAAREATEKTIRENGYDAFVSNEARRLGVNPSNLDDATKKAIDEAFDKQVKDAGEKAASNASGKGAGGSAKEATEGWFESQRKSGDGYSAPPNTQPSPTQSHAAKAEKAAQDAEQKLIQESNKDHNKGYEAFGGDQFKESSGEGAEAVKEWADAKEEQP